MGLGPHSFAENSRDSRRPSEWYIDRRILLELVFLYLVFVCGSYVVF